MLCSIILIYANSSNHCSVLNLRSIKWSYILDLYCLWNVSEHIFFLDFCKVVGWIISLLDMCFLGLITYQYCIVKPMFLNLKMFLFFELYQRWSIVSKVLSGRVEDKKCLTVLLTGKHTHAFGQQFILCWFHRNKDLLELEMVFCTFGQFQFLFPEVYHFLSLQFYSILIT
jgi:hypothetical protein